MCEHRFRAFGVMFDRANGAAAWRAQHHRAGQASARPRAQTRGVVGELVDGRIDEAGELNLCHRPEALSGQSDRQARNAGFGQRRVEDALRSEFGQKSVGRAEDAAVLADIFPQHHDAGIFAHRARQGYVDRLDYRDLAHESILRRRATRAVPRDPPANARRCSRRSSPRPAAAWRDIRRRPCRPRLGFRQAVALRPPCSIGRAP